MINNVVIKVNNELHGKKVIEWWRSRGVHTGLNRGNSEGMYYGVIDGVFGVYEGCDVRSNKDVRVIKLLDTSNRNQETPQFFAISPEDWEEYQELKRIRDCNTLTLTHIMNIKGKWELLTESFHENIAHIDIIKKVTYQGIECYVVEVYGEIYLAK